MAEISFTIMGEATPQGRPKMAIVNGKARAYDPIKSRNFKQLVAFYSQKAMEESRATMLVNCPLELVVTFYRSTPTGWSKLKKAKAFNGELYPIVKPDLTNLVKGVEDAMNGIIYVDDRQIVNEYIAKRYSDRPRTVITVRTL